MRERSINRRFRTVPEIWGHIGKGISVSHIGKGNNSVSRIGKGNGLSHIGKGNGGKRSWEVFKTLNTHPAEGKSISFFGGDVLCVERCFSGEV